MQVPRRMSRTFW